MKARSLFSASILCLASGTAVANSNLCRSGEVAAFSCSFGRKTVSLCATANLSREAGALYYRFGTPGRIELEFPNEASHPKGNFKLDRVPYPGGGAEIVKFELEGYTYSVYESFGGGNSPSSRWAESGLTVRKGGQLRTHLQCKKPHLGSGEAWVELLQRVGIPSDEGYSDEP